MPQIIGYCHIIHNLLYVMSTVIQYKHNQTENQSVSLVGSDAKNTLPTRFTALDMIGLSWVFKDEDFTCQFMRDC